MRSDRIDDRVGEHLVSRDVEAATLAPNGSPPITRTAFPTCRAHYPGGSSGCVCRLLPPHHAAFPKWQEGRHPHCHFRGLLRLHSRYGPPDRSAAHRRPLSRGSNPCGYPHKPLVSYRINRQLSGWIPPPLMIRAFGAHCQEGTSHRSPSSGRNPTVRDSPFDNPTFARIKPERH